MSDEVITTYLQDHHMGSSAGTSLFDRVAANHSDPEIAEAVKRIGAQTDEDQKELEQIMEAFDVSPAVIKALPAKIGEFASRFKPDERFGERSPLKDFMELEMLVGAVYMKSLSWRALMELDDPRIDKAQVTRLYERAIAQRDELEAMRMSQVHKLLED